MENNDEKKNYVKIQFLNRYLKTLLSKVEELCSLLKSVLNKIT